MQFFMLYAIKICFKYVNEKKRIQKYKIKDKQAKHTHIYKRLLVLFLFE